jgi:hypothetical protein
MRLARIGIEDVRGYLAGGLAVWLQAGFSLTRTAQPTVEQLRQKLEPGRMNDLAHRLAGATSRGRRTRASASVTIAPAASTSLIPTRRLLFIARVAIAA